MSTEPWTFQEVQALLSIIGEEKIQQELDGAVRNERIFRVVAERMACHGFSRTTEQLRAKCKKMRSDYRKVKDHNSRSGVPRKHWKWFDAMEKLYAHRQGSQGTEGSVDSTAAQPKSLVEGDGEPVAEFTSSGLSDINGSCSSPAPLSASASSPASPSPPGGQEAPTVLSSTPTVLSSTPLHSAKRRRTHEQDLTMLLRETQVRDGQEEQLSWKLQREHFEERERAHKEEWRAYQEELRARQEEWRARQEERRARQEERRKERQEERRARQEERQEEQRQLAQQSQVFTETFMQGFALLAQALRTQQATGPTQ